MSIVARFRTSSQEGVVLAVAALLALAFSFSLPGFATLSNALSIVQSVTIIGALGVALTVVVVGRGMDLSLIAVMTMPTAWFVVMSEQGTATLPALALAVGLALLCGAINGALVAYADAPGIFVTVGTGSFVYGVGQHFLVPSDVVPLSTHTRWLSDLWLGTTFTAPNSVLFVIALAAMVALFMRITTVGRFIYAIGDNPQSARSIGAPVRRVIMLQYLMASLIAVITGFVLAGTTESANTRLFNSTMIYDVILVVVLGGVGLSGGKGGVRNVVFGTILIGILINGMTILDLPYVAQNLIKAIILLGAIAIDGILNPRDEQVSQQGDI